MKKQMLIDLSNTPMFNVPPHIEIMIGDFKKNYDAYLEDKLASSISLSTDTNVSEKRRGEAKHFMNTVCFFAVAYEHRDVFMTVSRASSKRWKSDGALEMIAESVSGLIQKHKETLIHLAPYYGVPVKWDEPPEAVEKEIAAS